MPHLHATALTRRLSDSAGVYDIELQLDQGDILGLLGLNGAGKSTTLKLLTGLLTPDSGSVSIMGHKLDEAPLEARAAIGYLPDNPPLFNDMRVDEYLALCGRLHGLSGHTLQKRLADVMETTRLSARRRQLVGELSRGYRQRVGLAQALVHQPAVLILDEPGNGLDPEQLEHLRIIITDAAESAAVLFSTHQLTEAQAACNRIAIIHEGRLVADQAADGADLRSLFSALTAGGLVEQQALAASANQAARRRSDHGTNTT
ncbi:MAG: multidrug ABC transporter ATP-binding protein [Gammaproteobacteria bacterium]|nr:MAG: multidrug ABC transporter ATP-binding protein [Gammaproteobacteria bacterium]PIE37033.1 MAG: multidrug ABC transporter ATP-binding protein [Gammaproteobacteria bacterium]